MSRNLGLTECAVCDGDVRLEEETKRAITRVDAGPYFEEYRGMIVANAVCTQCGSKYLAWIDMRTCDSPQPRYSDTFFDLSYRSTFNDEPGAVDLPSVCRFHIERLLDKVKELEERIVVPPIDNKKLTKSLLKLMSETERHIMSKKLEYWTVAEDVHQILNAIRTIETYLIDEL